jgi:phage tail sheath protein FI
MALTYRAPGVYVEEIPSARQPIAGVGTNTVGFIGIVPNKIHVPVANPNYDPVLAQQLVDFERLTAARSQQAEAVAQRQALLEALQTNLARTRAELTQADHDVRNRGNDRDAARTEEEAARTALAEAAEDGRAAAERRLRAARTALTTAERILNAATERFDALKSQEDELVRQLPAAGAGATGAAGAGATGAAGAGATGAAGAGATGAAGAGATGAAGTGATGGAAPAGGEVGVNEALLRPVNFRPYSLQEFNVMVDPFDTKLCTNFTEYTDRFGSYSAFKDTPENPDDDLSKWRFNPLYEGHHLLTHAVDGFFRNGGTRCFVARVPNGNKDSLDRVLREFESIDELAIIAAPGLPASEDVWGQLEDYCENDAHQNVFAILDSPLLVEDNNQELDIEALDPDHPDRKMPRRSAHAAFYFPHIEVVDPAKQLQDSDPARQIASKYRGRTHVAPSGHVAGIYARTDEERGVHKAPANATVRGALEVKYYISRPKQELLNPQGVNCIRLLNGDVTLWGARTVGGDRNGEWKYVSVRRFAGFLEESIKRGTQWIVFEPNDPGLWSRIILNVTAFLTILWHNGALFGLTPQEAFYVKCDEELNPPEIRDLGQVITEIGVAIVRPAEFVIFRITQSTGARQG